MLTCSQITRTFTSSVDRITLDEMARHRRRMKMYTDGRDGQEPVEFLLDLPKARLLRHGDGLVLSDGRVVEVHAAPEPLYRVSGRDDRHLLALAWQIGNRHLPAQIETDHLLIRRDHVIADMLRQLDADLTEVEQAFDPEGGAYEQENHTHSRGHHHHD